MVLGERYKLVERIAAGGMGEVWRAEDELLRREVAVKLLRPHVAADAQFRERFRAEARITAGLSDPGIAQVYDYGEQDEIAYLVMELVAGEPLSAIIARMGPLSPEVTLDMVHQAARALAAAHRAGVIHRDVKPGNLLVTDTGAVKITDFGIARAAEANGLTQTGTVMGTAQYVSPEQAQGLPLTPSTDLYSLGVVAYECLAGHPPFRADTHVAIALQHLHEEPPPLPAEVPPAVRDLVLATLAKTPEGRPSSAEELADRAYVLRDSLTTGGLSSLDVVADPAVTGPQSPVGPATEIAGHPPATGAPGAAGRRRALAVLAAAGLAIIVIGVIMVSAFTGDREKSRGADTGSETSSSPTQPPHTDTPPTGHNNTKLPGSTQTRRAVPTPSTAPSGATLPPKPSPSTAPRPTPPSPSPTAPEPTQSPDPDDSETPSDTPGPGDGTITPTGGQN
ncbi:serine/threonine protein kinase [Bailinhaonella thermotolerans]|uniref:non-specific serine/threonine protein kinase n=1 Tax=Bailinhaonella thermotolerans TaxID=1070861 RepID=A0A3A4AVI7_9ACTN|nr:serine/threonine protein kinase [Bailinhaonella thermotolerans]